MSTVFVGGSRHATRLPARARERLDRIVENGFAILVGDAAGADRAVQQYLRDASYPRVTVFCSGDRPRHRLGDWEVCKVAVPGMARGFQFYAAKDREMALKADFGLMIWDGKSPGTTLNVLRLVRAGKKVVLLNAEADETITFRSDRDWNRFLGNLDDAFIERLRERATPEEWAPAEFSPATASEESSEPLIAINAALAAGDTAAVIESLGTIARSHGMTIVAKDSGLARESLYRSLASGGNPEFSTVLKVLSSMGLRLSVDRTASP